MSKKKSRKKRKTERKTIPETVRVVEITVPEEKPAPKEEPSGKKASAFGTVLKVACVVSAAALLVAVGLLFLRLQPLSRAYSLIISSPSFALRVGEENQISYSFRQATDIPLMLRLQEGKKQEVRFQSSAPSIVSVDEKGRLAAVSPGEADIVVTAGDMAGTVHVDSFSKCASLSFPEPLYEVNVRGELSLEARKIPEDGVLYEDISYSLSDENVLSFDENGVLHAKHPGTCLVRASAEGLAAETEVQVHEPMTGITLPREERLSAVRMERGTEASFPVRFYPLQTTDSREVHYSVSDPELGSVSLEGVFTALKPGNVTLTAECNGFTDRIEIEILSSLRGILLNTHEKTLLYRQTDQLAYALIPEDTTDDLTIAWASNNPRIVTVGENGLASAVGPGTAIVTLDVNGFRDQCIYHVHVPVTGVAISTGRLVLNKGQSARLGASVVPSFATEDHGISWRSDNPNIVRVDAGGGIYAVNGGTTRVYAVHGSYSNSCLVTVNVPVPREVIASRIISFGKQFLGTPYVYGGNSLTGGIDCSSFTMQCFATQGIGLPRVSAQQARCGHALPMDPSQWLPGDLLFYSPHGYVSHVAIYIGNGQILQSAESMGGVCITSYNYNGYTPSSARRIF